MQAAGRTAIADDTESTSVVLSARRARLLIAGVAALGLALDLGSKLAAVKFLDPDNPPVLLGGLLTLRLIRNPGAAFSLGTNVTWVFSLLAVAGLVGVVGWLAPKVRVKSWAVITGLMIAGIAGNFIDRVFRAPGFLRGHVVDFFQLPNFAIFNVADMCLTFAAAAMIGLLFFGRHDVDGRPHRRSGDAA